MQSHAPPHVITFSQSPTTRKPYLLQPNTTCPMQLVSCKRETCWWDEIKSSLLFIVCVVECLIWTHEMNLLLLYATWKLFVFFLFMGLFCCLKKLCWFVDCIKKFGWWLFTKKSLMKGWDYWLWFPTWGKTFEQIVSVGFDIERSTAACQECGDNNNCTYYRE